MRRTHARKQSKPCPGCQKTGLYRHSDELCDDCKITLKEASAIKAEIERRTAAGESVIVKLPPPTCLHWWPSFYMGYEHSHQNCEHHRERLRNVIAKLHYACSAPAGGGDPFGKGETLTNQKFSRHGSGSRWQGTDVKRLMSPEQVELWRELYDVLDDCFVSTFKNARRAGHNVLLELASGELSIADFNKATIGEQK